MHFWTRHRDAPFPFRGKTLKGGELRDLIRAEMHDRLLGPAAAYNLKAANGIACTTVTVVAAALGIRDVDHLSDAQRRDIQRAHLLVAMFNAMQPGVFALSGWDLVGALTLPPDSVKTLLADGDTRWINRGAYDLIGANPQADRSGTGLPRARTLYGTLREQLERPGSFASELEKMLRARATFRINESEQVDIPTVRSPGLVVMVHRLPADKGIQVTALNFARTAVRESVPIKGARAGADVADLIAEKVVATLDAAGRLPLALGPHEGRALLIK